MRVVIRVVVETLAACALAKVAKWEQFFTDGTMRPQVTVQNLTLSISDDDKIRQMVLNAAHILEGEHWSRHAMLCLKCLKLLKV